MQSQIKWFLFVILFVVTYGMRSYAQDMNVDVIVDMQHLPPAAQEKLVNFKQRVQDYLNKNKYHDEKIPPIQVQMQFSFDGVNLVAQSYEAKLFIASKREIYNPFNSNEKKYSVAFRFFG